MGEVMPDTCQVRSRGREFHKKVFCNNQNNVNLNIFPKHGGIFTWRLNADDSVEVFSLEVNSS